MILKSVNGAEKTITKGYKYSTIFGGGGVLFDYGGKTRNCAIIGNSATNSGRNWFNFNGTNSYSNVSFWR